MSADQMSTFLSGFCCACVLWLRYQPLLLSMEVRPPSKPCWVRQFCEINIPDYDRWKAQDTWQTDGWAHFIGTAA